METIRNQISLSALEGLIIHMGSLKEGRKALILVSEGYSDILPPQLRDAASAIPGSGNPNTNDAQAGVNDPNEARTQFFAASNMDQRLREVYNTANKYNVAIYAVDPRGLPTSEFDLSQPAISTQTDRLYLNATMDTLRVLSEQTDGRAIVNRNDLDVGMKQIIRDSSAYYLLGYNSSQTPSDGKFHEIKVRVKRAGVQVRARKGYWALTTERRQGRVEAEGGNAEGLHQRAGDHQPAGIGALADPHVGRDIPRRERQDEGHLHVGAGAEGRRGSRPRTARKRPRA